MSDLALIAQLRERLPGLCKLDLRIGPVHLVQIDLLDPEVGEALIDAAA